MLQIMAENAYIPGNKQLKQWLKYISQALEIKPKNITVRVVETAESEALNHQFRGKKTPTNVLSFPADLPEVAKEDYLGDIIICAAVVEQEAIAQNKPIDSHWAHMLVHGVLHLQGYDHITEQQAEEMEGLEIKLLASLDIANPYA